VVSLLEMSVVVAAEVLVLGGPLVPAQDPGPVPEWV